MDVSLACIRHTHDFFHAPSMVGSNVGVIGGRLDLRCQRSGDKVAASHSHILPGFSVAWHACQD